MTTEDVLDKTNTENKVPNRSVNDDSRNPLTVVRLSGELVSEERRISNVYTRLKL